jgi:hypothetical protein
MQLVFKSPFLRFFWPRCTNSIPRSATAFLRRLYESKTVPPWRLKTRRSTSLRCLSKNDQCLEDDAWNYKSAQSYGSCQRKRASFWAWIGTAIAVLVGGGLAVFLIVKEHLAAGVIVGAIAAAVILYMWIRVIYVGKKAKVLWEQYGVKRTNLRETGLDDAAIYAQFKATKNANIYNQQNRALLEAERLNAAARIL